MKLPVLSPLLYLILSYMFLLTSATNTCSPGEYSTYSDPSTCKPCQAGYYCPLLNPNLPAAGTTQTGCPPGTYMPYTGATSVGDCLKCEIGTHTSAYSYTACPKCPHGTYCDIKGMSEGTQCPAGTYQPNEGATSIHDCLTCPAGTLHPLPGGYECYPCPDGYICNDPAQTPIPISNTTSSGNFISTQILSTTVKSLKSPIVIQVETCGTNFFCVPIQNVPSRKF